VGDVDTIVVTRGQMMTAGHDGFAATSERTGARLRWTSKMRGVASTFAASGRLV
jgi:hypothetical protein